MPRALRSSLVAVAALSAVAALAALPTACQSGGVGDPCTPEDEYQTVFSGFDVAESYLESRSFQCSTRICLVNHFQGRVSCPLGQAAADVHTCNGPGDPPCASGESCVPSGTLAPACAACDTAADPGCVAMPCPTGLTCDPTLGLCTCDSKNSPTLSVDGTAYACSYFDDACVPSSAEPCTGVLQNYLCHAPGACQSEGATVAENQGKACCAPGTDTPVGVSVCAQCSPETNRDAANAVYCSCRCGVSDGDPPEPTFNFCACPDGFSCSEIRPDIGESGQQLTGKYCIRSGTEATDASETCGTSAGNHAAPCAGLAL
jgi:hypothetical protein